MGGHPRKGDTQMGKDKVYGLLVFLISLGVILMYTLWLPIQHFTSILDKYADSFWMMDVQTAVMLPVFLAMVVVFGIIAWIGWTMATTPPPAPIDLEELESWEDEDEEEEKEEKKED